MTSPYQEAAALVKRAVANGLMSYPANQVFKPDGTPDPMLHKLRHFVGQWGQNIAMRVYILSENGSTHQEIAARLRIGIKKIPGLIDSGRTLHKARAAAEPHKWGKDPARDLKRIRRAGNAAAGHPDKPTKTATKPAEPSPRGGNPTKIGLPRGGQSGPGSRRD